MGNRNHRTQEFSVLLKILKVNQLKAGSEVNSEQKQAMILRRQLINYGNNLQRLADSLLLPGQEWSLGGKKSIETLYS